MLKRIQLTNFKKHESLTIDFADGLTALKGANEAGKSTLIQAVAYALFGTKALPQSLEETVTYDKPVGTLKVTLDFVVDGVDYSISRGKSGAELTYAGGTVTGQTETTNFIGNLLGADAQVATRLFLANQGDIRGILDDGAKAVQLIEKLAEFDQLDNLIDLIQAKLVTGSVANAEAAVEAAQQQLDGLPQLEAPDLIKLKEQEEHFETRVKRFTHIIDTLTRGHREAAAELANAKEINNEITRAESNIEAAKERLAGAEADLAAIKVPKAPANSALDKAKARAREAEKALELAPIYKAVKPFLNLEPLYDAPYEDLEKEIDSVRKRSANLKEQRVKLNAAVETTLALKVAGSCSLCGKDVSEVAEVVAKNEQLEAKAASLKAEADDAGKQLAQLLKDEAELLDIRSKAKAAAQAANKYAQYLELNTQVTPPTMSWPLTTDFDKAAADLAEAEAALAELNTKVQANAVAEAKKEQAQRRVEAARGDLEYATQQLGGRTLIDLTPLQDNLVELEESVADNRGQLDSAKQSLMQARSEAREAVTRWEAHLKVRATIEGTLSKAKEDLRVLQFNNTLLKAVRAARPVIADKLWALVLGAVSRYFSDLRGDRSLITKSTEGFAVNGRSVAGLSGSTKDILGLAVRVALVRTFIPQATLLVLDEPTAAMDADRTATTLGFLASTGFKQTLIVSHEDATEAVADHLIQL